MHVELTLLYYSGMFHPPCVVVPEPLQCLLTGVQMENKVLHADRTRVAQRTLLPASITITTTTTVKYVILLYSMQPILCGTLQSKSPYSLE